MFFFQIVALKTNQKRKKQKWKRKRKNKQNEKRTKKKLIKKHVKRKIAYQKKLNCLRVSGEHSTQLKMYGTKNFK